ncbi:MAG: WYL domain-containing protein [Oscillospiraceae bacterium]
MEIFSEIYGCYYEVIRKILEQSPLKKSEIDELIRGNHIIDTSFFLSDHLFGNDREGIKKWGFLNYNSKDKCYYSSLNNNPFPLPMTTLEKSWIKALLQDDKFKLFLSNDLIDKLQRELADVQPLFNLENFYYFDKSKNGDDFSNPKYKDNFNLILSAIDNKEVIHIEKYLSSKGKIIEGNFQPLNLEYSSKDDIFRLFSAELYKDGSFKYMNLKLSGITNKITITDIPWNESITIDDFFTIRNNHEPITVKVSNERNSIERFMMEFSCYKKVAEYDAQNDSITVKIYYDIETETELLIRLISFGCYLEILSPLHLRLKAKERIQSQYKLFFNG